MKTISIKQHKYVLENDRALTNEDEKTYFWITPRTVRDGTDIAESYGKAFRENKRKGRTEMDKKLFNSADDEQWIKHVVRIENAFIAPESPEGAYDYFILKVDSDPDNYKKEEDGYIRVISAESDRDRLAIFHAMSSDEAEEIVSAVSNYSTLQAGSKNL